MTQSIKIVLLFLVGVALNSCHVHESYTLSEYRQKTGRTIESLRKVTGEQIIFSGDSTGYDSACDCVRGLVHADSEASIAAKDIRLIRTSRPNPILPYLAGLGAAIVAVMVYLILTMKTTVDT